MIINSEIKHGILLSSILLVVALLAFTLEDSEINLINNIKINGNKYLSEEDYLNYSQLNNLVDVQELSITLIRDRLEKHPYINNIDVLMLERGDVQVTIFEKKMDAILLNSGSQYMITNRAEIIPLVPSTRNLDLPVIVNNDMGEKIKLFGNARSIDKLFCAMKIISTAEFYDRKLYKSISEITLSNGEDIILHLSEISSPIYFGIENEIEKTVFLSKIFKHMKGNSLSNYLNYVDLRYNELVYLGFDEQLTTDKGSI